MHFHLSVITIGSERIDAAAGNTSSAGWDGTHGGAVAAACAGTCDLRHEILDLRLTSQDGKLEKICEQGGTRVLASEFFKSPQPQLLHSSDLPRPLFHAR